MHGKAISTWTCGDAMRNMVSGIEIDILTEQLSNIYSHGKNFKKAQRYSAMVHRAPNTLTVIDKVKHGKKRRIISQGFSDAALKAYEPVILKQVQQLRTQLMVDNEGREVPSDSWSPSKNMARLEVIEKSNVRVGTLAQAPELTFMRLDKILFPEAIKARDKFITFIDEILREGIKAASKSGKGVFATLTNAKDPETKQPLGMKELGGESATLIVAGTDTTSTALAASFFYLSHNRAAYERVTAEIRSVFHSLEEIKLGPQMNQCIFLRACIDESMRMSPSAASSLWRETEKNGATVDSEYIPAGVDVGTCIYSIHHNPAYYPQPFSFHPERWISDEAHKVDGDVALARSAFNPFSIGPRSCIGKGLAYVELQLALAHILWAFDFRLALGEQGLIGEGSQGAEYGRHRPRNPHDEERLNDLAGVINRVNASVVYLTPSVVSLLPPAQIPGVKTLALGGESVREENISLWAEKSHLVNIYGPAVCSAWSTVLQGVPKSASASNIGYSLSARTWIASEDDASNKLCSVSAVDELLIEGPILARGYLNDDVKTDDAFIPAPAWLSVHVAESDRPTKVYKTGDLA
ncbi:hypothetical protein PRK78_002145 [Emydomyces testavorans]|uniref:AMP-dependent synthetase/ligase domain-containing protein n=1 Tax=Emydomyces testavorans TaxID=2070801 RepID=A0AAF0IHC5_9EURO|nr:hypothetical protein PRK78_002145 [Emydomyces testavorans]